MKISVFGIGYVGCVSLGCLAADGHTVIGVDSNESKLELIEAGNATVFEKGLNELIRDGVSEKKITVTRDFKSAIESTEISIICVGTTLNKKGELNLTHVFKVAEQIGTGLKNKNQFHIVSIRSSIPPGTILKIEKIITKFSGKEPDKNFSVLSNPEFLREGSALQDYYKPPYTLIGGTNHNAMKLLASLYKNVKAEVIYTAVKNAELIKFVNNSFHALKVSFANEIGNICSALDMDSHKFMELFLKDKKLNISVNYLNPGFSYGGSCLPKDLKALENIAGNYLVETPVLKNISLSNEVHTTKVFKLIESKKKKNIGMIGITFKDGTDDVRNSPHINLIKKLLSKKYNVKIFDPNLKLENVIGANKEFLFKELPVIADYLVASLETLIEETELLIVGNSNLFSARKIKDLQDKIIIDLVRIDKSLRTKDNYVGLSW